jgi:hypothetical protein
LQRNLGKSRFFGLLSYLLRQLGCAPDIAADYGIRLAGLGCHVQLVLVFCAV